MATYNPARREPMGSKTTNQVQRPPTFDSYATQRQGSSDFFTTKKPNVTPKLGDQGYFTTKQPDTYKPPITGGIQPPKTGGIQPPNGNTGVVGPRIHPPSYEDRTGRTGGGTTTGGIQPPVVPPIVPPTTQPTVNVPTVQTWTPGQYTPEKTQQRSYQDVLTQARAQLDPTYQRALEGMQTQQGTQIQEAGEAANLRGIGRSGLSADMQNKVRLASLNQMGGLAAQRATQESQMAQALLEGDFARAMQLRNQGFSEYMGQQGLGLQGAQFGAEQSQRQFANQMAQQQFDWNKRMGESDMQFRNRTFDQQQKQNQLSNALAVLEQLRMAGYDTNSETYKNAETMAQALMAQARNQ